MILIITSKRDGHVDSVANFLDDAKQPWVRLNTEDIPQNLVIAVNPQSATGTAFIRDSGRQFRLEDVRAVWYRKPDPPDLSHFAIERAALDYVEAEFSEMLQGLYALLRHAYWINDPLTTRLAHRKLLQLRVASDLGFVTPSSLVTNDADAAFHFAASLDWDLAIKSLGTLSVTEQRDSKTLQYGVFTRRVTKDELMAHRDKIPHMPTIFQQYIEKSHELRVTCVGDQVFCCRIDSQASEDSREDFRFNARTLRHEIVKCPSLEPLLSGYLKAFELHFGCFDIAVTPAGDYVFFECNPNGQWLWIQELTGAEIGKAVAGLLVKHASSPSPLSKARAKARAS